MGGEGGMIWENRIEAYTLPYVTQKSSGSLMYDAGYPKSVLCDNLEGEGGRHVGGVQDGGDVCIPVSDSCCYMAKTITIL